MYGISEKEEIMKVIVEFPMILSMIQFNPFLGKDIELYQQAFEKWYSKNYAPETFHLSRNLCGCKGTAFFSYTQGKE